MANIIDPPNNAPIADTKTGYVTKTWLMWFWTTLQAHLASIFAPADADYIVGTANSDLSAERVLTSTATITRDLGTAGQAKLNLANTAVTPGAYTNLNATIDAQGRVVLAASGSAGVTDAEYIVAAAHAGLSAERVATDTATIDVDNGTAAQTKWSVIDDSITDAKLRNAVATSVIGRSANSTGDPADIAASANQQILGRRSSALSFTEIADFGYWGVLTNGDPASPDLIYDANGDVISMWTAT